MKIKHFILKREIKLLEKRIFKLESESKPKYQIENAKLELARLNANEIRIGGDKDLLELELEKYELKTANNGKKFVLFNDKICYLPHARHGRYITIRGH